MQCILICLDEISFIICIHLSVLTFIFSNSWIIVRVIKHVYFFKFSFSYKPKKYKLDGVFFFRHLLPKSLIRNETLDFESKLSSGHPIFLYLHGSTGTRFVSFSCKHFMALSCSELMPIFFSFLFYGQWLKERVGCNINMQS